MFLRFVKIFSYSLFFLFVFLDFLWGKSVIREWKSIRKDFYHRTERMIWIQEGKWNPEWNFSKNVDIWGNTEYHWLVCSKPSWEKWFSWFQKLSSRQRKQTLQDLFSLWQIRNIRGEDVTFFSANCKNFSALKFFFEQGLGKSSMNHKLENLWFIAAKFSSIELLEILQKYDVPIKRDMDKNTVWHIASRYGDRDFFEKLNQIYSFSLAGQNNDGETFLHKAVFYKNSYVDLLIKWSIHLDPKLLFIQDNNKNTIFLHACRVENIDLIHQLLLLKVQVNHVAEDGLSCLHWSLYSQERNILRLLLEYGVNLEVQDKQGRNLLIWALELRNYVAFQEILKRAPKLVQQVTLKEGASILHWVVAKKDRKALDILLPFINDVNLPDKEGNTSLFWAIRKKFLYGVTSLFLKGAQIHITNIEGNTPLHEAAKAGFTEVIPTLLKKGALKDVYNLQGRTPFQEAVKYQQIYTSHYLR